MSSTATRQHASVRAEINYAGEIEGRAVFDAVDPSRTNLAFVPHTVEIHDARPFQDELSLDREGFQLVSHTSSVVHSTDLAELDRVYHQEMAELIKQVSGAREVVVQRSGLVLRTSERAQERVGTTPARFAHLDYTRTSAEQFRDSVLTAEGAEPAPYSRYVIYQAWRATSTPPHDSVLALVDATTVGEQDTRLFYGVFGPEGAPMSLLEAQLGLASEDHRWLYFSDMTPDEVILFKGFDSDSSRATGVMHTAFDDPMSRTGSPRASIESRFFAFFD
ncbi:CmcJ/NvfI family oxidoreductase [Streptomyces heilongjiangensis]|uniref:CmcJ/NvfI family oxidoreductase n=1 Tax=Streptomyces heilongjiangensis TaxID=945052 RepID=A0ABW1B1C4_9ACTN|nr:CmcJ/NvfI family oxidoreductase [Streptomyces heilongjiangensis]MDC2945636.1 CmcJ/NvfI family oxidoreductase [Streptomyces heilongjiangensis]